MRSLRYLNTILTLIAVLLTLNLWTAWTTGSAPAVDLAHQAHAQGASSSGDRQQTMIEKLTSIDKKVGDIDATLTSGQVRVKIDSMPAAK